MGWFDWMYSALASLGMLKPSDRKLRMEKRNGATQTYEMTRKTLHVTILSGRFRFQESVEKWEQIFRFLFRQRQLMRSYSRSRRI